MRTHEFFKELYDILDIGAFKNDIALNGVQITSSDKEMKKVAFAVDACLDTIVKASDAGADVLVVHHGLFWGQPLSITGSHYERVRRCIESDMALFAAHIPLDAHPLYGNNAQMALKLGMSGYDPFGTFRGMSIGFKGELPVEMTLPDIAYRLGFSYEGGLKLLPFGKTLIKTVGIVSGGAGFDVKDAIEEGLDLFITGDCPHEIYHLVEESGINMISGGHYRSELFGVKALERLCKGKWGLETMFVDSETGL